MYCVKCGSKLTENAKFCGKCGAKVNGVKADRKTVSDKKRGIITASVIFVIVVLIVVWIASCAANSNKSDKRTKDSNQTQYTEESVEKVEKLSDIYLIPYVTGNVYRDQIAFWLTEPIDYTRYVIKVDGIPVDVNCDIGFQKERFNPMIFMTNPVDIEVTFLNESDKIIYETSLDDFMVYSTWLNKHADLNVSLDSKYSSAKSLFVAGKLESSSDFSALSKLTNLEYLRIIDMTAEGLISKGNGFDDYSSLSNMKNLIRLEISNNKSYDLSHLSGLSKLEYLSVTGDIWSIDWVSGLNSLETLFLYSSDTVSDITPFSTLKNLRELSFGFYLVSDISPLTKLKKLEYVNLGGCDGIVDYSPLDNIKGLIVDK